MSWKSKLKTAMLIPLFSISSSAFTVPTSCDYFHEAEQHFLSFQPSKEQLESWLKTKSLKDYRLTKILYRLKTQNARTPAFCDQLAYQFVGHYGMRTVNEPTFRNLSDFEALSIRLYTSEDYAPINALLRAGREAELQTFIRTLDAALAKLPPYIGVTYRGANLPAWIDKEYQPGKIVPDPAYLSTSDRLRYPGKYRMTIHGHTGRWVDPISQNKGENEILFPRGTSFKILKRVEAYGFVELEMVEL